MIFRSTTFRFAALVFVCQLAAAGVLLVSVGVILEHQSFRQARANAESVRDELLASYAQGSAGELTREIQLRRTQAIRRGSIMLLADHDGRLLAGNLVGWPNKLPSGTGYIQMTLFQTGHVAPETMLVRATRLPGGEHLLTGIVIEGERQMLGTLGRASMLALALALLIAVLVAWLTAQAIERRLATTIETLRAVRGGDIDRRVPTDRSGDAFAALGQETNLALDRVATLIDELKIATDSLAHDLKSPLSRLRNALERTLAAADEPGARAEAERALAESDRLRDLVDTALSISRAEAGIGRESFQPTHLGELLETIGEIYAPVLDDQQRAIAVEIAAQSTWPVHRQLVAQAIGNLVDNAIKYSDGAVGLRLDEADGVPVISVRDEGPGIPPARQNEALRRFSRLDAARQQPGAGLGLTLAQAVAHLHGGTISFGESTPGFVVTVRLG